MVARVHRPAPPLAEYVACLWLQEGCSHAPIRERALPTGTAELVFDLRAERLAVYERGDLTRPRSFPGAIICGPHSELFAIDRAADEAILGVHFKPGGLAPFLRYPATAFRNTHVALEQLWGGRAGTLRERLRAAPTPEEKFRLLEAALLVEVGPPMRHPAVAFALREFRRQPDTPTIAAVRGQLGLSARRFGALFAAEVGLTPKRFCRIRRFQRLIRHLEAGHPGDWASLALSCGYYDQAHFLRDFRAFSGLTPTAYLVRRGAHPNHVSLEG